MIQFDIISTRTCHLQIQSDILDWTLVAEDTKCNVSSYETQSNSHTTSGYSHSTSGYSPDTTMSLTARECANSCRGVSTMFSFTMNGMDASGCHENHPECICERYADQNGTCPQVTQDGTQLYRYKMRNNGK